jgi:hypothetical protein
VSPLQILEAMHADMIAALQGRKTVGAMPPSVSTPASVVMGPTQTKAKRVCSQCGGKYYSSGLCRKCYAKADYAKRKQRGAAVAAEPEPAPVEVVALVEPPAPEPEPEPVEVAPITTGDSVRIITARYSHPFRYGAVGQVVEIERQSTMNWIKVRVGQAWHNFPESEVERCNPGAEGRK